jgi:hypothetical protein
MKKVSDSLRRAILGSEMTRAELSRLSGVDQATLSLFTRKKGGISIKGVDALARVLRLELRPEQQEGAERGD